MKSMKVLLFSVLTTGLLFSAANARMMGGGKGMMCEKMGMMGKGGGEGIMGQGMMGMMHGHFMKKGLHFYFSNKETLGLTGDQLDKLHNIKIDFKKSYIMDKARLEVATLELEALLDADRINMKVVEKKVKDIAGLKEKLLLAKVRTRVDAKKALTEEQMKKAKKLRRHTLRGKVKGMELKEKASQKEEHEKHH